MEVVVGFITLSDVLAAIATLADAIGEALVALTLGFAATPTGIGFLVGSVLVLAFGSVVPVSFQVESLTIVSRLAERKWKVMVQIVLLAGAVGALLGIFGAFEPIVAFIDGPILFGMMTGAGLILAFVAIELVRENKIVGGVSVTVAVGTYLLLIDHPENIVIALTASVVAGVIAGKVFERYIGFEPIESDPERERFSLLPFERFAFLRKAPVLMGALALLALRTGTSITFTEINAGLAGVEGNVNHTNIIAGSGGAASALFGGAPTEPIISGTAAAPNPVTSAALFMALMGLLLVFGLLPKIAKLVPPAAISGFLIMLGTLVIMPAEIGEVVAAEDPVSGPVTVAVTAGTFNPFLGMVAGIIIRAIVSVFGLF